MAAGELGDFAHLGIVSSSWALIPLKFGDHRPFLPVPKDYTIVYGLHVLSLRARAVLVSQYMVLAVSTTLFFPKIALAMHLGKERLCLFQSLSTLSPELPSHRCSLREVYACMCTDRRYACSEERVFTLVVLYDK